MSFDLPAYLDRLGLPRPDATRAGLAAVQRAQMRAIPFENLDPLRGITPDLSLVALQRKLVTGRRGGYCFEQNSLLSAALEALGLPHRKVLARVRANSGPGGGRTHLALLVEVEGATLLADAGFGGPGADTPLPLDGERPVEGTGGTWRLRQEGALRIVEKRLPGDWQPLYEFDEAEVRPIDLEVSNHYCATHPASPFPTHVMLARHAADGRRSLWDRRFTSGGETRDLVDAEDFHQILEREFTLSLPRAETDRAWRRILEAPVRDPV